jgi:hypothetical protein
VQLVNLNEDALKDGAVIYPLCVGEVNVGRPDHSRAMQIKLVRAVPTCGFVFARKLFAPQF